MILFFNLFLSSKTRCFFVYAATSAIVIFFSLSACYLFIESPVLAARYRSRAKIP